jgi:hypothetical protein
MERFLWFLSAVLLAGAVCGASPSKYEDRLGALQTQLETNPTNKSLLFQLGDLCFDEGGNGNHEAVLLAEQYFIRLLALDASDARAQAMLGSTFTMKGRDAIWPTTRLSLVRAGNEKMDTAVIMAPNDPLVRFTRAFNNFHMPRFMNREKTVKADFAWLWQQVQTRPATLNEDMKLKIALCQGALLKRQHQNAAAIAVWQAGIAFNPESPEAKEMREQIAETKRAEPPGKAE